MIISNLYLNETRVAPEKLETFASLSQLISKVIQIKGLNMSEEIWKPVLGYEGLYEVSNLGRVKSLDRCIYYNRLSKHLPRKLKGGYLNSFLWGSNKYLGVVLIKNGIQKSYPIHVIVLSSFISARPEGFQASHQDGNKYNNKLDNLKWETPKENQNKRKIHGTSSIGSKNGSAKLNESQVYEIKVLLSNKEFLHREIAIMFGVTRPMITAIARGVNWTHVKFNPVEKEVV